MKLRALRVHGFKSFADSTEIEFHDGITAVVGPNGCGKSNISDAIRWVLGEQRPTAIRGARMEEAIFQGSVNRRPVARGSVSLLVSNEDQSLPVPFEEVELARTVYRDGGSEYSINRTSCRLRDVLDLCRDTGLGANAYAIIENRMIDAILSDRAEERRALFEEAAGIGRYKDRRKAALRRLERAELDLQRLDDVIGEVESKVRSLARQKGKAQRYQSLRDRRLAVEVSVVRIRLGALERRLEEVERELSGDRELGEGFLAELRTAESRYETIRLDQAEAEKNRGDAARRVEGVRQELVRWERDLAVAAERAGYVDKRLVRIDEEREETRGQIEELKKEKDELELAQAEVTSRLGTLLAEQKARHDAASESRRRLETVRGRLKEIEVGVRDLTRRQAHLEGEAASAEAQEKELGSHLARLRREMEEAATTLSDVQNQGDLFADREARMAQEVKKAKRALETEKEKVQQRRRELERARKEEALKSEALANVEARADALEGLDRSQEGLEPTSREALELEDDGILGILGECLGGDPEVLRAVEAYMGPLVQGLVVRDRDTVSRLLDWYGKKSEKRGGLILLPLDRVGSETTSPEEEGSLLGALHLEGPGAPWVRRLLSGIDLDRESVLPSGHGPRPALTLAGTAMDAQGIVRIGNPLGSSGIVERRERLKILKRQLVKERREAETSRLRTEEAEAAAVEAEATLDRAWSTFREAEDALRAAVAEARAQSDQRERLDRLQEELARQIEGARAARARARDRAREAREDREAMLQELERLRQEEEEAGQQVSEAQEEWERTRAEETRIGLDVARGEGEQSRLRERLADLDSSMSRASIRMAALQREETSLQAEKEAAASLRDEGARANERLFGERDEAEADLARRKETAERLGDALREAERRMRQAREAEREAVDRRHRLELERQELSGQVGRIQDRLEGEWGKPLAVLLAEAEPVEGEPEELKEELAEIVGKLEKLGPVNMLAVEEHEEESARLEFLLGQRDDLQEARNDLRAAISQINETATQLFKDTFSKIRDNFRTTFLRLFEGGEADLWLEDEEAPLEALIEIHASPRGKKTQRIDLLSGGERALTALSLLFGIYLVKPSPFCVMDEVDAPLDESNIYRFIRLLQEFKDQTQFIVITHNARTIEAADWIYGVTMEEPGVSRIVGVRLEDALQVSGSAA